MWVGYKQGMKGTYDRCAEYMYIEAYENKNKMLTLLSNTNRAKNII